MRGGGAMKEVEGMLNCFIGAGTEIDGKIKTKGPLRIDGIINGKIYVEGKIIVGSAGKINDDIYADSIVIGGTVHGNIFAKEMVILLSTGKVYGNITTPRIIMEEGGIITGQCKINHLKTGKQ